MAAVSFAPVNGSFPSPQAQRHVSDMYEDLRDGHNLISLLEVLSGDTLVGAPLAPGLRTAASPLRGPSCQRRGLSRPGRGKEQVLVRCRGWGGERFSGRVSALRCSPRMPRPPLPPPASHPPTPARARPRPLTHRLGPCPAQHHLPQTLRPLQTRARSPWGRVVTPASPAPLPADPACSVTPDLSPGLLGKSAWFPGPPGPPVHRGLLTH